MATDPTNLVEGDDTSIEDTAATDAGVEQPEEGESDQQFDDDGNPIEPDEDEEVDLDDIKLKVPKDQAQKVREALLRQADYTRKTQAHAENVRAFEAERAQYVQASNAELEAFAVVRNLQAQMAQYQGRNFAAELAQANANYDDDAARAIQAQHMHAQQLRDAIQGAVGHLNAARQQRVSTVQQDTAKRMEETRTALVKEIPGWSGELEAKLTDFGVTRYGFSADEVADIKIDPRIAKVLHDAYKGQETAQKQQGANRHLQAQQAQPAATVRANAGPPKGLDDRLSMDEWMKRREKQVRNKAAR